MHSFFNRYIRILKDVLLNNVCVTQVIKKKITTMERGAYQWLDDAMGCLSDKPLFKLISTDAVPWLINTPPG